MQSNEIMEYSIVEKATLLSQIISKVKTSNKEHDLSYISWIDKITSPNFNLISLLIQLSNEAPHWQKTRESLYSLLHKFHSLRPEIISQQILLNTEFPKSLLSYLNKAQLQHITNSSIFFLRFLLKKGKLNRGISEKLMKGLFDILKGQGESELLVEIGLFLAEVSKIYMKDEDNLFLIVHKTHCNAFLLDEILLRLLLSDIGEEGERNVIGCLEKIMKYENSTIFAESDLESFIDIILERMQKEKEEKFLSVLLRIIEKITQDDLYYVKLYKIEELTDLIENYHEREEQSEEIKKIFKQIIVNLVGHQAKKI